MDGCTVQQVQMYYTEYLTYAETRSSHCENKLSRLLRFGVVTTDDDCKQHTSSVALRL